MPGYDDDGSVVVTLALQEEHMQKFKFFFYQDNIVGLDHSSILTLSTNETGLITSSSCSISASTMSLPMPNLIGGVEDIDCPIVRVALHLNYLKCLFFFFIDVYVC